VCNDSIIALELKAEPASILLVQVYMPTSKYQDDQVDEMYNITEAILEEERKRRTNIIKMGDWNSVAGDKSHRNIAGPHGLGRISQRGQRKGIALSSPTYSLRRPREDCTPGKPQIKVSTSWTTYL
jgi:exonuclease III